MDPKIYKRVEKVLKNALNLYVYARLAQLDENVGGALDDVWSYDKLINYKKPEKTDVSKIKLKALFTISVEIPQYLRYIVDALVGELVNCKGRDIPTEAFKQELSETSLYTQLSRSHYIIKVKKCDIYYDMSLIKCQFAGIMSPVLADLCVELINNFLLQIAYIMGSILNEDPRTINSKLFMGIMTVLEIDQCSIDDLKACIAPTKKKVTTS
jgi:hypothetical protein